MVMIERDSAYPDLSQHDKKLRRKNYRPMYSPQNNMIKHVYGCFYSIFYLVQDKIVFDRKVVSFYEIFKITVQSNSGTF